MKNLLRFLVLTLAVAMPAFAQDAQEAKTKAYTDFYNAVQANKMDDAYRIGKEYLGKYGTETDQYTAYIKTTVEGYEKNQRLTRIGKVISSVSFADPSKANYNEAFTQGRQILQTEPENLNILITLGYAGYSADANKNSSFNQEAIAHARKAISLIESGRQPEKLYPNEPKISEFYPFSNREEALAYLNYALGELTMKTQPAEAITYLTKAVQFNTPVKTSPITYVRLANAYAVANQYDAKAQAFQKDFAGKPETPESKAAQDELFRIVEPIMDAHARAISYSGTKPEYQKVKENSTQIVTQLYQFRNDSVEGLPAYLSGVTAKPLPQMGAAQTAPATGAATTTTPAATATPATTPTPTTTATPSTTTTTTTPPASKPATTPVRGTATATPPTAARPATNGAKPSTNGAKPATAQTGNTRRP